MLKQPGDLLPQIQESQAPSQSQSQTPSQSQDLVNLDQQKTSEQAASNGKT